MLLAAKMRSLEKATELASQKESAELDKLKQEVENLSIQMSKNKEEKEHMLKEKEQRDKEIKIEKLKLKKRN